MKALSHPELAARGHGWYVLNMSTSPIEEKYQSLGGKKGFLGPTLVWPWDKERACDDKIGRYQKFKNGCIHWHPTLGAFETHGSICTKWNNNKQEKGFLGYPISDEMDWSADDLLRMLPVNWEDLHDPKFNWPPWLAYTVFPSKLTQLGRWSKFERGVITWWEKIKHPIQSEVWVWKKEGDSYIPHFS